MKIESKDYVKSTPEKRLARYTPYLLCKDSGLVKLRDNLQLASVEIIYWLNPKEVKEVSKAIGTYFENMVQIEQDRKRAWEVTKEYINSLE